MPLPANNTAWPPAQLATVLDDMGKWSAWYEGTPTALRAAYGGGAAAGADEPRPGMVRAGGVRGALERFWWGRPTPTGTAPRDHLHVPIAADLCQASADLLFAEQPTITAAPRASTTTGRPSPTAGNTAVQDRITELVDDGFYSTLAEAAEIGAALGSSYLRVGWDRDVRPDAPFLSTVDADGAWPEFRWGMLRAVTFWTIVATEGQVVWRHLERHELDPAGVGVILHGLYEGRRDNLGRARPITDRPETAVYATAMSDGGDGGVITTASPGLAVVFVPNQRPQRRWRKDPLGSRLGRSDLDGVEGHMDSLDEVYSSWMRDVRLGKARLLLAKTLLDDLGPGRGARFDPDREVFSPVNALAAVKDGGMPVEQVQFAIRFAEHQATARQMVDDILRTAGYSSQTFGEADGAGGTVTSGDTTATEVRARERRSYMTRDRKIRHWTPALATVVEKLLAVDVALFGGRHGGGRPDVEFPDGVQDSMLTLGQTALVLRQAEAASDETIVELLHPDWEPDEIDAEVRKIGDAREAALPDPAAFDALNGDSKSGDSKSGGKPKPGDGADDAARGKQQ